MNTIFCSHMHEEIIEKFIEDKKLKDIPDWDNLKPFANDYYLSWLCNVWRKYWEANDFELKNIHFNAEIQFAMANMGPMINLVSDSEWENIEQKWNSYFYAIKTFDTHIVHYFLVNQQLSVPKADCLRIACWYYSLYYLFGTFVFNVIKKYPEYSKKTNIYSVANECMTSLQLNLINFVARSAEKMGIEQKDILLFVSYGLRVALWSENKLHHHLIDDYEAENGKLDMLGDSLR